MLGIADPNNKIPALSDKGWVTEHNWYREQSVKKQGQRCRSGIQRETQHKLGKGINPFPTKQKTRDFCLKKKYLLLRMILPTYLNFRQTSSTYFSVASMHPVPHTRELQNQMKMGDKKIKRNRNENQSCQLQRGMELSQGYPKTVKGAPRKYVSWKYNEFRFQV